MENLIFGAFATLEGYREGDAANLGRTVYDLSLIHISLPYPARVPPRRLLTGCSDVLQQSNAGLAAGQGSRAAFTVIAHDKPAFIINAQHSGGARCAAARRDPNTCLLYTSNKVCGICQVLFRIAESLA